MIAHEEFREAYKENVELQVAILSGPIQDEMSFSYTIECNGIDEPVSISLDENNEFTAKIQTTFSLVAVDQGLRGRLLLAGGQVCTPSIDAPFHKLIMPDVETINFEVKSGEMQFTVGVTLVIPKMSYPMYSLTVECLSLPMVGGGLLDVSDPFLRIHKKSQAFGTSVQVFESEVIQDNSNPLFKPIKISNQRLCSGDQNRELVLSVWDHSKRGTHKLIGELKTSLKKIIEAHKAKTPVVLVSASTGLGSLISGTGKVNFKEVTPLIGPSFLQKIKAGSKLCLMFAVDCTNMSSETTDVEERLEFVTMLTRMLCDKLAWFIRNNNVQFFGLNGKCCTEKYFSNTSLDLFPVSGSLVQNSFLISQLKGELFLKTMNNFFYNTEGGTTLKLSNFITFFQDHADSIKAPNQPVLNLGVIFLWAMPTDLQKVSLGPNLGCGGDCQAKGLANPVLDHLLGAK